MDDMKACFKCRIKKSLTLFYRQVGMKDGHLNKCIKCTKRDVSKRYYDPAFRNKIKLYEKKRFNNPIRKKMIAEYQRNRRKNYPGKAIANRKIGNGIRSGKIKSLPCEKCGSLKSQAHHEDYRKPLSVRWLCFKHHRESHNQIID